MTKFAPDKTLKLIARGKLTFDARVVLPSCGLVDYDKTGLINADGFPPWTGGGYGGHLLRPLLRHMGPLLRNRKPLLRFGRIASPPPQPSSACVNLALNAFSLPFWNGLSAPIAFQSQLGELTFGEPG